MLSLRLKEIAVWTRGVLQGGDADVCGVSTDSRTIKPGELFVALVGEQPDGHDHVNGAVLLGAAAVMVSTASSQRPHRPG